MKKIISLLLAACMTITVFVGCSSSNSESDDASESSSSQSSNSEEEEEPEATPIPDPETVVWYVPGTEQADQDIVIEELNEYLLETANIQLELVVIASSEYDDRMLLATTSGEYYDLCFTSNWRNNFAENMARESFLELDALIEEYGQDMLATLPEKCLDSGLVSGSTYAINNYQYEAGTGAFYIRNDLIDKYGWDVSTITEFEDIYPILEELATAMEDGTEDSILAPYQSTQVIESFFYYENILSSVGLILDHDDETLTAKSRYIESYFEDYCNMQYMFFENDWVQDDIATAAVASLRKTASYGVIFHGSTPTSEITTEATYGAEYTVVQVSEAYITASFGQTAMTAININSENPEASMKLMNLIYSDSVVMDYLLYGIEGVHYNLVDGLVEQVADSGYDQLSMAWVYGNTFLRTSTVNDVEDWKELSYEIMDNADSTAAPGFTFDTTDLQNEIAQVTSVISEYAAIWYETSYEDFADEFISKLYSAGYQTLLDELQAQLDAYKEEN